MTALQTIRAELEQLPAENKITVEAVLRIIDSFGNPCPHDEQLEKYFDQAQTALEAIDQTFRSRDWTIEARRVEELLRRLDSLRQLALTDLALDRP